MVQDMGVAFFLTATSSSITTPLKQMHGDYEFKKAYEPGAPYSYDFSVWEFVPLLTLRDTTYTYQGFISGTVLDCSMFVDVEAVGEITGGQKRLYDTVIIP